MVDLSIVIPAYNEAKRLPPTIHSILNLNDRSNFRSQCEVIVVDDGSLDRTVENVKTKKLKNQKTKKLKNLKIIKLDKNYGKGFAVKTGVKAARGKYILMMDADGSIPITELDKLWPYRSRFDIVIGSRFLAGSRFGTQNIRRMMISKIGNILFRILFKMRVHDTQCGFKLFNAGATKRIFENITIDRFGFDMEVLVLAKKYGYTIKEVPIKWHDSPKSSVRALRSSWQTLREVLLIWWKIKNPDKPD
jgi:dolichyl-phosphate beta-glucosyltransferase